MPRALAPRRSTYADQVDRETRSQDAPPLFFEMRTHPSCRQLSTAGPGWSPRRKSLSGERAEILGSARLKQALRESHELPARMVADLDQGQVRFRTTVMLSNEFKASWLRRKGATRAAAVYQRIPMSRWVWVTELVRRPERDEGLPCVLGEAVMDATEQDPDRAMLAWRVPRGLCTDCPTKRQLSLGVCPRPAAAKRRSGLAKASPALGSVTPARKEVKWSLTRASGWPGRWPAEDRIDVIRALRQLSPQQRATIYLVDGLNYTAGEVAALLGIAAPTVRVHLFRGRRRLAVLLATQEGE